MVNHSIADIGDNVKSTVIDLAKKVYHSCLSMRLEEEAARIATIYDLGRDKVVFAAISACVRCLSEGKAEAPQETFAKVEKIKNDNGLTNAEVQEAEVRACARFIQYGLSSVITESLTSPINSEYKLSVAQMLEAATRACANILSGSDPVSEANSKKIDEVAKEHGLGTVELQEAAIRACAYQLINGKQVTDIEKKYDLSKAQMSIAATKAYETLINIDARIAAKIAKDYLDRETQLAAAYVAFGIEWEKGNFDTANTIALEHDLPLTKYAGNAATLSRILRTVQRINSGDTSSIRALVRELK